MGSGVFWALLTVQPGCADGLACLVSEPVGAVDGKVVVPRARVAVRATGVEAACVHAVSHNAQTKNRIKIRFRINFAYLQSTFVYRI